MYDQIVTRRSKSRYDSLRQCIAKTVWSRARQYHSDSHADIVVVFDFLSQLAIVSPASYRINPALEKISLVDLTIEVLISLKQ